MTTRRRPRAINSRRVLDQQVSESQLQRDVLEMAKKLGWLAYHVYDSRMSGPDKGFPDIILAKREGAARVLAIELKTERGRVSTAQWAWLAALMGPLECYVWRPRDWSSGEIEAILAGRDGQRAA